MAKRILTCLIGDLFHVGHLNLLLEASKLGDLYVAVGGSWACSQTKGKTPVINAEDRLRIIANQKGVHFAFIHPQEITEDMECIIEMVDPDIYVRGDDWTDFPAKETLVKHKIPIKYLKYTEGISSTKIKEDICTKQC